MSKFARRSCSRVACVGDIAIDAEVEEDEEDEEEGEEVAAMNCPGADRSEVNAFI